MIDYDTSSIEEQMAKLEEELREKQKLLEEQQALAEEQQRIADELEAERLFELQKQQEEDAIIDGYGFWEWLEVFQYIVNFWVIALPWAVIGFWCNMWNVFLNVDFNRDWAGGNVVLMGLTAFGWVQYILSIFLVFELDTWLRRTKFIRFISLMAACIFNFIYLGSAYELFVDLNDYINTPYGTASWFDVYVAMVIFYNLVLHVGVFIINWVIMTKEFSLEYFQFLGIAGGPEDDISLGMHEFVELWIAIFDLFNPWWWFSDDPWIYY